MKIYADFSDGCKVTMLKDTFRYTDEEIKRKVPCYYLLKRCADTDIQKLIDRNKNKGE